MKQMLFLFAAVTSFLMLTARAPAAAVATPVHVAGAHAAAIKLRQATIEMAGRADASEAQLVVEAGPCAHSRLLPLQQKRQRLNYALSAGHSMTPMVQRTDLEVLCARLDFTLSNGAGNALGLRQ
jgi:hypothetical protein